ncbi:MAG TPA: hypothetical protein VM779_12190 [Thermoanaerobaculia bacterium]|nr:hypothetical protein [Thermoanaerobaculia bacterium]
MNAGAQYGLLLAIVFIAAGALGSLGTALFFLLMAAQLAVGAVIVWRRTGLPWATLGDVVGAVGALAAATLFARGIPLVSLSAESIVFFIAALTGPLLLAVEAHVHRQQWQRWRAWMSEMSAIDVLLGRHIPDLRRDSA